MDTVIKNATIFTDGVEFPGDIAIRKGTVAALGCDLPVPNGAEVIDAEEKYALPGAVDLDVVTPVSLKSEKSLNAVSSAMRQAIRGGVTTVNLRLLSERNVPLVRAAAALDQYLSKIAFTDYTVNVLLTGAEPDLEQTIRTGVSEAGIKSFCVDAMHAEASGELIYRAARATREDVLLIVTPSLPDIDSFLASEATQKSGGKLVSQFPAIFPPWAEAAAIERIVGIMRNVSCRAMICPVTSSAGIEAVRKAKQDGVRIHAATALPYLALTKERYTTAEGYLFTAFPPLREKTDHNALWLALDDGLVSVVASGHAELSPVDKQSGVQKLNKQTWGMPGIGNLLRIVFSEGVEKWKLSAQAMTCSLAADPAKLLSLYPKKGTLVPGADADIVLLDPDRIGAIDQEGGDAGTSTFEPYKGMSVKGAVDMVMLRGKVVVSDGEMLEKSPQGRRV